MASQFQQQSLRRKIIYFGLILGLFTATLALRRWPAYGVEAQAEKLELREQNLGDVELTDKALRLTLTGSRGFAVCGLWYFAQEKQKKHEWNELDLLVRSLIKLQPHFITPWMFQSWNLAYNVSVECDRVSDKYFYICRGIALLAEGNRLNKDNPDMRLYTGIYTQNKMGISDETNTLRSLYQMSGIDPIERDPSKLRRMVGDRQVVDLDKFEEFCRRHPHLVRRLRERLKYKTPDEVVEFLAANQKIPSRFEDLDPARTDQQESKLKPVSERVPVLPPQSEFSQDDYTYDSPLADDFENYAGARAWFSFAQDPLIKAHKRPRYMAQVIFEGYPARAQAYIAERWEQEGWFGREGWEIKDWFPQDKANPTGPKRLVVVGNDRNWAGDAWEKAYQWVKDHGERHGLYKTPEELHSLTADELTAYTQNRMMTNFAHHLYKADVERTDEAVTARKYFFKADQSRRAGDREQALAMYENPLAFPAWKKIMNTHKQFRQDNDIQEETYILQAKYLRLLRDKRQPQFKNYLVLQDLLVQAAPLPAPRVLSSIYLSKNWDVPFKGPFDDKDEDGLPLISDYARSLAESRPDFPKGPTHTVVPQTAKGPVRPAQAPKVIQVPLNDPEGAESTTSPKPKKPGE